MKNRKFRITPIRCLAMLALTTGAARPTFAADEQIHSFDVDPHWEKFGITTSGDHAKRAVQDFGWRPGNKAGGAAAGEIGGIVTRWFTRCVYWKKISTKTLNDKLTISGRFAVPQTREHSGVLFGFFNETSRGRRPLNSLIIFFGGENKPGVDPNKRHGQFSWVFANARNSAGVFKEVGAFDGRLQDTKTPPIMSDGKPHDFLLAYDPGAADSPGELAITIDGATWKDVLPPGFKTAGAEFNRFGIVNAQYGGDAMECYFDDVRMNGELFEFTQDPGWEAVENKVSFTKLEESPYHDLRWSKTNFAGGEPGELLVTMWRETDPAYYADKIGPLTLDHELYAEGRLAFANEAGHGGVYLGWFNSEAKRNKPGPDTYETHPLRVFAPDTDPSRPHHPLKPDSPPAKPQKSLLAIAIDDPAYLGHRFRPVCATSQESRGEADKSIPIAADCKPRRWTIHYDPKAAGGNGRITATLDNEKVDLDLKPEARREGITFDRFGFLNIQIGGGHYVKLYVDDVKYTTAGRAAH